jgi:hypothetical protein
VTEEMVEPFLEGMTLSDAMSAKKIYICDLKVMEGVDGVHNLKVNIWTLRCMAYFNKQHCTVNDNFKIC